VQRALWRRHHSEIVQEHFQLKRSWNRYSICYRISVHTLGYQYSTKMKSYFLQLEQERERLRRQKEKKLASAGMLSKTDAPAGVYICILAVTSALWSEADVRWVQRPREDFGWRMTQTTVI
jgi:hypothetical protein